MSESYIQNLFADRIGGSQYGKSQNIYKFEKIKRAKRAAMALNPDAEIIDMGVGEPDEMAFPEVVSKLCRASRQTRKPWLLGQWRRCAQGGCGALHGFCLWRWRDQSRDGSDSFNWQQGSAFDFARRPDQSLGILSLMTVPGYPVFGTHSRYYGGLVYNLKLSAENNFFPDLDSVPGEVLRKTKVLVLNYPNNPTGAAATPEFFARVVEFAQKNKIIVIHDAAYAGLIFEGKPLSFLATPGAKEVGLELHSVSKSYNMTGWRCGFVTGHPLLVKAYGDVKDNTDSGQFLAIQHAAAYCLDHPEITRKISAKYSRRMDGLVKALRASGFDAKKPKGSFFLYVKAPRGARSNGGSHIEFGNAEDVSQWLIKEKLMSTVPWDEAGTALRFSVTFAAKNIEDENRILDEIGKRLGSVKFEF